MAHEKTYTIGGMDCANCAREVETGVAKLSGVNGARVDFATAKLHLDGDVPFEVLKRRVEALGKTIEDPSLQGREGLTPHVMGSGGGVSGFVRYLLARRETQLAIVGGLILLLALAARLLFPAFAPVSDALYVLATLVAGYPVARSGLRTLLINHDFNINLLMTIAAVGAIFIQETAEAATVIFLFAIGEALEGYTADRARNSLRSLMTLAPAQAVRLRSTPPEPLPPTSDTERFTPPRPEGEGPGVRAEEVVPVEALRLGDRILVRPGERIPMDGDVLSGESGVNQAPITGESLPVRKTPGAPVFAGTVNGEGALEIRVTRLAADNTLSRIIRLVEEAQSVRAPSQRLIDRFARVYTPGVVVVAAGVALLPPLLFNAPFYDVPGVTQGWLYRALELLVIACPCSLVISTPVTIISAITAAARRGVLIKGGAHLEALGSVKAVAFDKTGTLTTGQPAVLDVRSIDCETGEDCAGNEDLLALAAAVERRSTHPLAQAIVRAAEERDLHQVYRPAEAVTALAGRGVQGQVNGKTVTIGSHSLFDLEHPHAREFCDLIEAAEQQGRTAVLLSDGDRVRGFITVADAARADSRDVVDELKALGLFTVMLTGDNAAVADSVGRAVGVGEIRAGLLPADKVDAVKDLQARYGAVVMVGDGVNDTPALAAAAVGVAMGGAGSAQALETADVALMADDLTRLPYAVRLSRFARGIIRQNIAFSLGMKLIFMLLAVAGLGTMWLAVFADMGMSLAVTLNGMRPLRVK
ncbi:heavy metal translocating P-type ATPase [Anaerolineae bacterium CFX8]|nr:heavy metal translocating P-type ATPase [Anaerolineae bacterium CFX8]